ncbi:MAG: YgiQ family radical SAM protein [Synergistaceae bacterium]|nr:YgiQ family radical SAM protein [Synergistaceae bacterium]
MKFLPTSRHEMLAAGWDFSYDFLFVSGDAYVDHPSFASAVICRVLESKGYRVAILPQPDWKSTDAFSAFPRPKLGVLVGAGNLDSMLNKLTANKKTRSRDAYSPGGATGLRPPRATIVYCQRIRQIWGNIPLIIGGVEASLRRFAHYDYWSDSLRQSILIDSQADLLVYGMGERAISEIAGLLKSGIGVNEIREVRGTCYVSDYPVKDPKSIELGSWDEIVSDKAIEARSFKTFYEEQDPIRGKTLVQKYHYQGKPARYVVQLPPAPPLTTPEMDAVYDLPYARKWHPAYDSLGGVPALEEVKWSVTSHRGCFGSCAFCALHAHQGRIVQARSHDSIIKEAKMFVNMPEFKGIISDVGGPTANFRHPSCSEQLKRGTCKDRNCLHPSPCRKLDASHSDYLELLRELRAIKGIKKVFIRSGFRYDYLLAERESSRAEFLKELCSYHISGQLKVAPEHVASSVLDVMRKGNKKTLIKFMEEFAKMNAQLGKKQYLVPYFMTSHPGCGLDEAVELAVFVSKLDFMPEQAQDFIPTPGSLSSCIYHTGVDPFTEKEVHVPRAPKERKLQRALLQHRDPNNREFIKRTFKENVNTGVLYDKMLKTVMERR